MRSALSTIAVPLAAMFAGVAERTSSGRTGAHLGECASTLFPFAASLVATLLPATERACVDCPSGVSSSLVPADQLSGRFSLRGSLPFFQCRFRSGELGQGGEQARGDGAFHFGDSGIAPLMNRRNRGRHGVNLRELRRG
jgi:hypothetical protein